MSKQVDKFIIFGKKFAKLDNEGQDKLVKTAYELLKTHQGIKDTSASPSFDDDMKVQIMYGFNAKPPDGSVWG